MAGVPAGVELNDKDAPGLDFAKQRSGAVRDTEPCLLTHASLELHGPDPVPEVVVDSDQVGVGPARIVLLELDLEHRAPATSAVAEDLGHAVPAVGAQVDGVVAGIKREAAEALGDAEPRDGMAAPLAADVEEGDVGPLPVHVDGEC